MIGQYAQTVDRVGVLGFHRVRFYVEKEWYIFAKDKPLHVCTKGINRVSHVHNWFERLSFHISPCRDFSLAVA